jgi:type I restriction enzyme S subunit
MSKAYMYILQCADGSYYVGSAKDLALRLQQHQNGAGANHTKKRLPVKLLYFEEFSRIDEAFYREKQVQGWSRKKKEALIEEMPEKLHDLAKCMNETSHVGFNGASAPLSPHSAPVNDRSRNVPKLRFPEFEEGWKLMKLDNLLDFKNGINASKEDYGFGYKFINVLDIIENDFITYDKIKGEVNVSKEIFEKNLVQYGDILFQRSSETREEVGQSNVYLDKDKKATFGGFVIRGKKISDYEPFFFHLLLKSSIARKEITTKSGGSTRYNVGQDILSSIKLPFPNILEQQKIANFLTSIDNRIQTLEKKKTLLAQYKKGVMQKIFSQEIRFKDTSATFSAGDGKEFPEWNKKKLGELTYKVGKKNKQNIQYPIYSINNQEGFRPQSEQFEGLDSNDRGYDISLYKIVNKETFAYNPARINVGSIGYSYELNEVIISSLYVCFKTKKELDDLYLLAYLDTDRFNKDILRYQEGGVRQYLFYENFSQIKIPLPSNEEQIKIANFLSAIDKNIVLVTTKIEHTKAYKKGLLQQMFV